MNGKRFFLLLTVLVSLLAGCGEDGFARPGIVIEVRDARTGMPAWYDATVIARDGAYADTIAGPLGHPPEYKDRVVLLWAAENRTGTYEVTITHPQYQTWYREGIRVRNSGESSPFDNSPLPETVHIVAELQPLDGG